MIRSPQPFNCFEIFLILFSLTAYLIDTVTDILVGVLYFRQGHVVWGSLTVGLVILASLSIQIFSGRWYVADGRKQSVCCWFAHLLQLQPFERYVHVLSAGMTARKFKTTEKIDLYYYQQNDVSMLRLFEAFLESAPQLTLQMYIIFCTNSANWLTGLSACISLLALGWAVASYSHALRQAYQDRYTVHAPGLLVQTIWHVAIAAARVLAIVAFASVFKYWVFLALGVHWILMTIWVILQDTDFCPSKLEEKLFDGVVAIIYCFTFFNLKEGNTRWRALAFYTVMFLENGAAITSWYFFHKTPHWYDPAIIAAEAAMFFFGIGCMLMYYRFCHPNGPISCCCVTPPEKRVQATTSTPNFNRSHSVRYSKNSKGPVAPQYTSTIQLPRRTLLKPQNSKVNVEYKEVFTPSQLSPIKPQRFKTPRPNYYDCSLQPFEDTSCFKHYSVDATAGLFPPSRVATLQGNGMDLSSDDYMMGFRPDIYDMDSIAGYIKTDPLYNNDDEDDIINHITTPKSDYCDSITNRDHIKTIGVELSNDKFSTTNPLTQDEVDSAMYDTRSGDISAENRFASDMCNHCKKTYRYMDQSFESLGNRTVAYCHCTMSEEQILDGYNPAGAADNNKSIASESSGFQSHIGYHIPNYIYKDIYPSRPSQMKLLP